MAESGKFSSKFQLAQALARGFNVPHAARDIGVPERTARRWAHNPKFRRWVAQLQLELSVSALGKMSDAMSEAATVFRELLTADVPAIRLQAARQLIELTTRLRETVEFESRLCELEQKDAEAG